jgi:hypothetical protein
MVGMSAPVAIAIAFGIAIENLARPIDSDRDSDTESDID